MKKLNLVGKPSKKYATRYPWDRWFLRPTFVLTQGKEFVGQLHGMASMVRNRASVKGVSVSVVVDETKRTLTVTVHNKGCACQRCMDAKGKS